MRKLFLFFLLLIAFEGYTQSPIKSISKTYLRDHPFDSKFSTFILNLQRDPWFTINEFNRRTDSTFFFLNGTYKNFNPFRYTPTEVKLIIAEEEIVYSDSLQTHDTIMNLQSLGIVDSNVANSKLLEKELKRFNQAFSKQFDDFNYKTLGGPDNKAGELYSYFITPLSIAPVTVAWGLMPDKKQYSFVITIRFKVSENQAVYITQPGELKGL